MRCSVVFVLMFAVAMNALSFAQPSETSVPKNAANSRFLFPPIIANTLEPRVGLNRLIEEQRLRLDIGNSIDIFTFSIPDFGQAAIGADFFTWTSLRQAANFHFPVDAVDYLFGINASFKKNVSNDLTASFRFRLSHISAHLVDGSFDKTAAVWSEGRNPRVYSREFLEGILAVEYKDALRLYAGGQYIYHIDPAWIGKALFQCGAEYFYEGSDVSWLHPYIAYDFKLHGVHAYVPGHSGQAGIKFGQRHGSALNVFVAFFNGYSQHGEYFDMKWSYWGPGFTIDF